MENLNPWLAISWQNISWLCTNKNCISPTRWVMPGREEFKVISFCQLLKSVLVHFIKVYITLPKSCRIRVNLSSYHSPIRYLVLTLRYPRLLFSFILLNLSHLNEQGRVSILSIYPFLVNDTREQLIMK